MRATPLLGFVAGLLGASSIATAQADGAPAPSQSVTAPAAAEDQRASIDLNTADIPTLEAVPEIGTDLANAVVAGRPYKSVEDAVRVLKLSSEKMVSLRSKVFVSPPPPTASTSPQAGPTPDARNNAPSKPPQTNEGKAISGKDVAERYDRAQAKTAASKK